MGRLFLLVEIDSTDPANHQIIDEIQHAVTGEYYGSETFQIESAFERALQKTNERLRDTVGDQLDDLLKRLNIIIAVLKDTTLHFTVIGRMHAFLVHRQRIIDVLDTSDGASSDSPSPLKIFTNVVSGQLNLSDTLLFCTTSLLDHLSQEKLKRIILERNPQETVETLESLLAESGNGSGFGALVIRLNPEEVLETQEAPSSREYSRAPGTTASRPQDSMEELIAKERATNTLLTHSLWPNVGRILKSSASRLQNTMEKKPQASQPTDAEEDEIEAPRQRLSLQPTSGKGGRALAILGVVLRGLGSTLGLLFRGLSRLVISSVHGIRSLTKGRRVTSVAKNFPHAANRNMARSSQWWTRLSTSRRRVLLVAIVLILLFAQSVLSIGDGRERKKQQEEYASLVLQAKESVAAADAALLIDNESGAREQLTKAMELLGRIPDTKNAPREEVAQTKVIINEKLGTIRHAIAVTPESVADLAGLEVGFSATVLGARADDLFTVSSRSSSIFRITPADKSTATVVDAPSLEYGIISFVPGGTSLLALAADGGMQSINPADGSLSSLAVQYQNVDRNVIAATIYNSRLYTLDSLNNQIFRHERSGAGYGLGNAWVSEVGADVRDAQSMAIDGTVFVLMKNGSLLNFSGGKKSATTFDAADPVLSEPTMLFTDADTPTLFVLDAKEHRIVEFEKDGTFLRQYVADAFASAANIVVVDGTIYILAGTQILSTPVVTEE